MVLMEILITWDILQATSQKSDIVRDFLNKAPMDTEIASDIL